MNEPIRPKVLYIDDEEANLFVFKISFRRELDVLTAEDAKTAFALLESNPEIRAVISDLRMPKMNGIEFITLAKQHFADKKYFLLSGFDYSEEIHEAVKSQLIVRHFVKPFEREEVLEEVRNAIGSI